jgi:hypothetical protein
MKLAGIISTAALSLILGIAAPLYAQEQHDEQKDQQEQKDQAAKPEEKHAQQEEKKAQEPKSTKPEEKTAEQNKDTKQEEKNIQHEQQGKAGQQTQHGRIPEDRFRANFGREHTFRVTQIDYQNRRFQYGGYAFGFIDPWPANWLYTQNVFVVEIDGMYYLCNPVYPGVYLALSFSL